MGRNMGRNMKKKRKRDYAAEDANRATVQVTLRLPQVKADWLDRLASAWDMTRSEWVIRCIDAHTPGAQIKKDPLDP